MPVYNGEKKIKRAIRSIQNQTLTDWELIAVDDGSTDESSNILDRFAVEDKRIKVLHKQNEGVSIARQDGVYASNGDYIIQFDCDDWAEPDYLESLYNVAIQDDADLVWCSIYGEETGTSWRWTMEAPEDPVELIKSLLKGEIWGTVWNRLIKSSICKNPNVSFPVECVCWEDYAFLINVLLECKTIKYCDKYLYHYDISNLNSITHANKFKRLLEDGYIKAIEHIQSVFDKYRVSNLYCEELRKRKLRTVQYYIDVREVQDFNKFVNTYPDAINHIGEYPDYPLRLKQSAWLICNGFAFAVPLLLKFYGLLRRFGYREPSIVK